MSSLFRKFTAEDLSKEEAFKELGKLAKKLNEVQAEELLKDIAFNLRRLVLTQGGGQWKGTKTITIQPKQSTTLYFVEVKAAVMVHIANITNDKTLWLFNDQTYVNNEAALEANSFPLPPGMVSKLLLEYKELVYVYNPNDEPAKVKVDIFAERTCYMDL